MLVLTRKLGDVITIGKDIQIQIVDVRHAYVEDKTQIKIGVIAPKELKIMRKELEEVKQ